MCDCYVKFDQEVYYPGQDVTGKVIVQSSEPIKANYLKVCAHGDAHTKWTESEHHHRTNLNGEQEEYSERVEYSDTINYLTAVSIVWRSTDGTNKLPAGQSVFPFKFPLPLDCPPSYEGFHGHVRYSIHVELDRPQIWKFNIKTEKCFSVIPPFDLNTCPGALSPMINTSTKNTGLIFKNGLVTMTARIPKKGYVPREVIPITVNIDNDSKKVVSSVRAYLHQCSHYKASRKNSSSFSSLFHSDNCRPHTHEKNEEKQLQESRRACKIAPRSKGEVSLSLKVPKLTPSFNCPIIGVDYHITVYVDTMSTFGGVLECNFPLIIGTIPAGQMELAMTNVSSMIPSAPPLVAPPIGFPSVPVYPLARQFNLNPPAYSPGPSAPLASPTPSAPPSYEESLMVENGNQLLMNTTQGSVNCEMKTPTPVHL